MHTHTGWPRRVLAKMYLEMHLEMPLEANRPSALLEPYRAFPTMSPAITGVHLQGGGNCTLLCRKCTCTCTCTCTTHMQTDITYKQTHTHTHTHTPHTHTF